MRSKRSLSTVLFTDIVRSTERASELGDRAWHELLERHNRIVREELRRWGGREAAETGDGFLALFDAPARAIVCARTIRDRVGEFGVEVRCGAHLGQVERRPDGTVAGIAVHIAARVVEKAAPDELVVTSVVRDAETGSGFGFEDLGSHELRGVEGEWRLSRVSALPTEVSGFGPGAWLRIRDRIGVRGVIVSVIAIAAFGAAGHALLRFDRSDAESRSAVGVSTALAERSVAVLPFENLSALEENEYFSDGVTEEIIAHLSQLPDLKVISRTSVMQYKEHSKSLSEIGKELGVATILEGSVRRQGERVRIVAQLISVETDTHLWVQTYDRELEDIFAIQSEVAEQIVRALRAELNPIDQARLATAPTSDLEAYNLYLQGRFHWNRRTEESLRTAIDYFHKAIERDPEFARAYAGIASAYVLLPAYSAVSRAEVELLVSEYAKRALELDSGLAEAHSAGALQLEWSRDFGAALQAHRRAIEAEPGDATAHQWYAILLATLGRTSEAIAEMERALELDPLSLIINAELGWMYYWAGDLERAIREYERTLGMDPSLAVNREFLWQAYEQTGRFDRAIEQARELLELRGWSNERADAFAGELERARSDSGVQGYWRKRLELASGETDYATYIDSPVYIATMHVALGEFDIALARLERAVEENTPFLETVFVQPGLEPLHDDPRFQKIVEAAGLTAEVLAP
jgi:TolB-like protein/class 3 adenylate cyclase/Tfp pilus assembly protein PilF